MKVISLLQPWATLVVIGAKKIETRSWNTDYRGEILIHASVGKYYGKGKDKISCRELCYKEYFDDFIGGGQGFDKLPFGAIIGKVNLVDTVQFTRKDTGWGKAWGLGGEWPLTDQEKSFGDYSPNRYGWLLSDPVQFANPIPAKGQLGIRNYDLPDHFHVPNKYGGHATFPTPPDQKTIDAVNAMVEIARKNLK